MMKIPPGFQGTLASQRSEQLAEQIDKHYDARAAAAFQSGDVMEAAKASTEGNLARAFAFALRAHDLEIESSRIKRAAKIANKQ
ncbi:MAG: hypothetical protein AAFZ18_32340 [Myxococcota bacterium]